jgi:Double zinc ribbon
VTSTNVPTGSDELERLFTRLVLNLAELDRGRLDGPIQLAEIHQSLVPYRTHRAALGVDTNQDYEMVVLRFLAGERGYARVEPDEVRHALEREARAVNPDPAAFRRYGAASVRLDPDQVRVILADHEAHPGVFAPGSHAAVPEPPAEPEAGAPPDEGPGPGSEEAPQQAGLRFSLEDEPAEPPDAGGRDVTIGGVQCGYCGGDLPVGRTVIFCPHCGQNVGVMHCPVCGTELDVGWRYCITCGREMAGLG